MMSIVRTNKMRLHYGYRITGEMNKLTEIANEHQEIVKQLGIEGEKKRTSPLLYLIFGLFIFFIWYFEKIITNK